MQLGDPSQTHHICSAYSRVDFDSEDEYIRFYSSKCYLQCSIIPPYVHMSDQDVHNSMISGFAFAWAPYNYDFEYFRLQNQDVQDSGPPLPREPKNSG